VYIRDREAKGAYGEPISFRVLRTSTFGDNEEIVPPTIRTPFEHQYKVHMTFPADGEYIVELSLPVEGRIEVIPFAMIATNPVRRRRWPAVRRVMVPLVIIRAVRRRDNVGAERVIPLSLQPVPAAVSALRMRNEIPR
jgi:hypothetical protein